jgi:ubiquinone/menaquinone biosynthesis C-methylase UbiE
MSERKEAAPPAEFDAYNRTYSDKVNEAIGFSGLKVDFFTRAKAEELLRLIAKHGGVAAERASVLDVGCGVGNYHALLGPRFSALSGVDVSTACIDEARRSHPGVTYESFDGTSLPFPDASFDVAFAICVFHHVPLADRPKLTADIRRVLKPGGMMVIFEHNPLNPLTLLVVNRCEFDKDAILLRAGQSESLLTEAGFKDAFSRYILAIPADAPLARKVDAALSGLPVGAQYYTLGKA